MASGLAHFLLDIQLQQLRGLLERLERLLHLAAFEENPAQAVEILASLFTLQSFADHVFGLFQVFSLFGIKIAEIIIRPGLIREALEEKLQLGFAFAIIALVYVNDRQIGTSVLDDELIVAKTLEQISNTLIASSLRPNLLRVPPRDRSKM